MKLLDKILFLQKAMNLSDHEFVARYKFKMPSFKKWKSGLLEPTKNDILVLCKEFNLDIDDFLDESSSVSKTNLKDGEHVCKVLSSPEFRTNIILEDFAREDNSRYEEKD